MLHREHTQHTMFHLEYRSAQKRVTNLSAQAQEACLLGQEVAITTAGFWNIWTHQPSVVRLLKYKLSSACQCQCQVQLGLVALARNICHTPPPGFICANLFATRRVALERLLGKRAAAMPTRHEIDSCAAPSIFSCAALRLL